VKALNKTPRRWTDLARILFYETLPLFCLVLLWTIAWAGSMVSKVNRELSPVHPHPVAIHPIEGQPPQITYADDSN
jgi:hypothetical protein